MNASTPKPKAPAVTMAEVLDLLSGFESNLNSSDGSQRMRDSRDHGNLQPIVDKLNSISKLIEAQAQAQAQLEDALAMITRLATLDFSQALSTKGDSSTAAHGLAIGLNMLAEELRHSVVSRQALEAEKRLLITAKEALEQNKKLTDAIVENIPVALFLKDPNDGFKITLWNKAAEDIFEIPRSAVLGKTTHDLWPKEHADLYNAADEKVCAEGVSINIPDEPAATKTRGQINLHTRKVPLRLANNQKTSYLLGVCSDTTAQRSAEKEIKQSHTFLQSILDASTSLIFVKDLEGKYLHCNRSLATSLGATQGADIVGKSIRQLLPATHADKLILHDQEVIRTKKSKTIEEQIPTPTGLRWHYTNISPMLNSEGEVYAVAGIVADIHDAKHLQGRYESLFKAIDEHAIVAITDLEGKITHANDKFCSISGYTKEELIGQDHRIVNSGYHPKDFFKKMWEKLSAGLSWQGEICNKRKDGSTYWVSATLAPYKTSDVATDGFIAIRLDISVQKEAQNKLLESSKMSSLGEMAAGVAHEINNPLAIISGKAASVKRLILAGEFNQEKVIEGLTKIETTAERIAKIVRGLRSFSRNADADPMILTKASTITEDTLELCRERFKHHSIDLRVKSDQNIEVECRPAQISQILINLLSNAHDAVENLAEKWVSLNVEATQSSIKFIVTDSGAGIPKEIVSKMMAPFFTTKDISRGTGLGLSISTGIARDHHGRLDYDALSKHTSFVLELPRKQPLGQSRFAPNAKKAS